MKTNNRMTHFSLFSHKKYYLLTLKRGLKIDIFVVYFLQCFSAMTGALSRVYLTCWYGNSGYKPVSNPQAGV